MKNMKICTPTFPRSLSKDCQLWLQNMKVNPCVSNFLGFLSPMFS